MDSKLIGSDIARQSRYELIHTTLVKFLKTCTLTRLSPKQEEQANEYLTEDSSKTVYRSDSDTLQSNIARIGNFIMEMLVAFPATTVSHNLLKRLFDEQYIVEGGKAVLRDKKQIKADSIQNPNDPDATYREKNDRKVQGYVTNITETVEQGKPNIITSVQVDCYRQYLRGCQSRHQTRQQKAMENPMEQQNRLEILRRQRHSSLSNKEADRKSPIGRAAQTEQR